MLTFGLHALQKQSPGEAEFTTVVDRLIRVLYAGIQNTRDRYVKLPLNDLMALGDRAIEAFRREPIVLQLSAPITLCGDLHGQFRDLLRFIEIGGRPPDTNYLFLGDYVDRGPNSVETFTLLLALKVRYPKNVWLLRGNHETTAISQIYGFFSECALRYNQNLWLKFTEVFKWLPLAAVVGDRIFCVHGGLSPGLPDIRRLDVLQRPIDIPAEGVLTDLLWADPSVEHDGFEMSERGTSYTFGLDVVHFFLQIHDFELIVRGHQVVPSGFAFPFRPDTTVLTLFSAPNYCGQYDNLGAIMNIDTDLRCSFEFLAPETGGPPQACQATTATLASEKL
jgi:serine/threonine-protein phosphatase PP1 catalytic subunit